MQRTTHKFDIVIPPQDIACAPGLQQRLAEGDAIAFEWVYKNYCKKMFDYAVLLTGDETTSEDIVQEVFIKLWRHKEKIRDIENFNSYLYALAKNHTLDVLKGNQHRDQLHQSYSVALPLTAAAADERLHFNQTRQAIKNIIEKLPETQRHIYALREQGYKRPAIAAQLGKTEDAVRGQINRMLNTFHQQLKAIQ